MDLLAKNNLLTEYFLENKLKSFFKLKFTAVFDNLYFIMLYSLIEKNFDVFSKLIPY
jgi:hypothetical protein